MAKFARWLIVLVYLLMAGCAVKPAVSVYMEQAEQALSANDDFRAYANYAYVIMSGDQAAAQRAVARVRESPRLRAAMKAALTQIQNSTAIGDGTRAGFIRDFSRRNEVLAYFKIDELDQAQQGQFIEASFERAAAHLAAARAAQAEEEAAVRAREEAELAGLRAEAAKGSRVTCATEVECRKAFQLAQIYVSTRSDMKIQLATDTIIETYNPTERNKMGAKVIKMPGAGQSAEIQFTVSCRQCLAPGERLSLLLMAGFRAFVESRLKQ